MQIIPLSEIYVDLDDRSRKQFPTDKSQELQRDILKNGLYHAPIVVKLDPPHELNNRTCHYKLVAGHRRTSAIRRIYDGEETFTYNGEKVAPGMIPVTLAQDDSPETIKEIELHENIIRLDLTWQEQNEALAQLHELRTGQNPTQTFKDTAQEVAGQNENPQKYQRKVSNAVALYKHRNDPDVANARTERDALAAIMRKYEETVNRATFRPKQQSPHILLHGDCTQLLAKLPDKHFSCLVTDPPYGVDADKFGEASKLRHRYNDNGQVVTELYDVLFRELDRVMTEDAHLYIFCDIDNFPTLKSLALEYNFKPWRTPLTWRKGNRGHLPSGTSSGWRRTSEWIMHATRGARLHTGVVDDVLDAAPVSGENKIHGAQKPSELYYRLLKASCYPGEKVLDPFCGTGPIFTAAKNASLKATGIEMEEDWIKHIESSLSLTREELL